MTIEQLPGLPEEERRAVASVVYFTESAEDSKRLVLCRPCRGLLAVAATPLTDPSTGRWSGALIFDRADCDEDVGR